MSDNIKFPSKPYPPRKHKEPLQVIPFEVPKTENDMRSFLDSIIQKSGIKPSNMTTSNPRYVANMQILDLLKQYMQANPDIRFWQALLNCGVISMDVNQDTGQVRIIDEYNVESNVFLKRVNGRINS